MASGDMARLYHQLSSYYRYEPGLLELPPIAHPLVLRTFVTNHRATFPAHTKAYPDSLRAVELPDAWPSVRVSATEVLAGTDRAVPSRLGVAGLARILHLSAGVVRVATRRDGRVFLFRPPGSAGGLFPLELYVAARDIDGLEDGVWWYDPIAHALRRVGPPPEGETSAVIVTGIPWRTGWRYAERGYRHIGWDAGTMLAHLLPLARSAGLAPRLWTRFPDAEVARLVGADTAQELPLAVVGLGPGAPAIGRRGDAEPGTIDSHAVEFPLITATHHAGNGDALRDPWPDPPALDTVPPSEDLDRVILRRGSARELACDASLTRSQLETCVALGLHGSRVAQFVAVSSVSGVEPGVYRWPDLGRPIRTGDLRRELWIACWEQDLCLDAAAVVIAAVDLEGIDDRGYLEAQIDAGITSGRLQLAATALGFAASGMTFLDSRIPDLLGLPLGGLLFTCLGVAPRHTKRAGTPRRPTDVSES